jgi:uncharacterized integral membrane protein
MRILKNLVYILVIVAGIVLASANMTPVRFVYMPSIPLMSSGETAATEIPLALLLLAFLLAGAFVAGTGTFVEHVRLRFLVRRNAKVVKALRADLDKTRTSLEEAEAQLAARAAELSSEQSRARKAEEAEAAALAIAQQERSRADEAVRHLPAPAAEA